MSESEVHRSLRILWAFLIGVLLTLTWRAAQTKTLDHGDFSVSFAESNHFQKLRGALQMSDVFVAPLEHLNSALALHHPVKIEFCDRSDADASYDSAKRTVTIAYGLIDSFQSPTATSDGSGIDPDQAGVALFALYHAVAHALTELYAVPLRGSKEMALDELAAVLAADNTDSASLVLKGAEVLSEALGRGEEKTFVNRHLLTRQRLTTTTCRIGNTCPDDFSPVLERWRTALAPHLKRPLAQ